MERRQLDKRTETKRRTSTNGREGEERERLSSNVIREIGLVFCHRINVHRKQCHGERTGGRYILPSFFQCLVFLSLILCTLLCLYVFPFICPNASCFVPWSVPILHLALSILCPSVPLPLCL